MYMSIFYIMHAVNYSNYLTAKPILNQGSRWVRIRWLGFMSDWARRARTVDLQLGQNWSAGELILL